MMESIESIITLSIFKDLKTGISRSPPILLRIVTESVSATQVAALLLSTKQGSG